MSKAALPTMEELATQKRTAEVISTHRITPEDSEVEVRELVMDIDDLGFQGRAGHNIAVLAPVPPGVDEPEHVRMYSLADILTPGPDRLPRVAICVRRCGERGAQDPTDAGISSNFLCDLQPGDSLSLAGPFGIPFDVPEAMDANVVLIGTGTGIAPFRAFVKHLYRYVEGWEGKVWLFYGAKSGLEFLYMNDHNDDLARYCDEGTFQAFRALGPKPNWADPLAWDHAFAERGSELWEMMESGKTYIYVAGLKKMSKGLDGIFARLAGGEAAWAERKAELVANNRWTELLY